MLSSAVAAVGDYDGPIIPMKLEFPHRAAAEVVSKGVKEKRAGKIFVENVVCEFFRKGASVPDFEENVIAFGVNSKGDMVGIFKQPDGSEDYCERQIPTYTLRYVGKPSI